MRIPKVTVIYDRKKKAPTTGEGIIEIRISMNNKIYYISTGKKATPKEFRQMPPELSERVSVMLRKIASYINSHISDHKPVSILEIRDMLSQQDEERFLDFVNERAHSRNVSKGTLRRYNVTIDNLYEYGQFRTFKDITAANIIRYDEWLHHQNVGTEACPHYRTDATVHNYHKILRMFISEAVVFHKVSANPYDELHGRFPRGDKEDIEYLSEEEMRRLMASPMPTPFFEHARDLFVFQTWTALSYCDLGSFTLEDYVIDNGRYRNDNGHRGKNGKEYVSQLLTPALDILKKYNGKLPVMNNADYNRALKVVAAAAGIKKNLHSHMARSTFATYALSHGVPMQDVAKMLGHVNATITMKRYAKVLKENIHDDFDRLEDGINTLAETI